MKLFVVILPTIAPQKICVYKHSILYIGRLYFGVFIIHQYKATRQHVTPSKQQTPGHEQQKLHLFINI